KRLVLKAAGLVDPRTAQRSAARGPLILKYIEGAKRGLREQDHFDHGSNRTAGRRRRPPHAPKGMETSRAHSQRQGQRRTRTLTSRRRGSWWGPRRSGIPQYCPQWSLRRIQRPGFLVGRCAARGAAGKESRRRSEEGGSRSFCLQLGRWGRTQFGDQPLG